MKRILIFCLLALVLACAKSPLGRRQLTLMPDDQMNQMGIMAFDEMKTAVPIESDPLINAYVRCIADPIVAEAVDQTGVAQWEIVVFQDETPNAFALPGGKIGVHTGLLTVAGTPDQLAAVIGHEVGHVIARHSNERVSTSYVAQTGLSIAQVMSGEMDPQQQQYLMAALGIGAQVGIMLPYSRSHEREADLIGLDLMAQAGFDPEASVQLWYNMMAAGGGAPPEWLSTHPSGDSRIEELEERMPLAHGLFMTARQNGKHPRCVAPPLP